MKEQEFVDEDEEPNPELNRLTNLIIGAAIEVHKRLGPGHLESVYENALAIEFGVRGIAAARQVPIEVYYRDQRVGVGRLDFLVEGRVIVDVKAVEALAPIHTAQMISYLRITKHKLALLINFNVKLLKDGIKRIAL
jgi:GxxExxY protein